MKTHEAMKRTETSGINQRSLIKLGPNSYAEWRYDRWKRIAYVSDSSGTEWYAIHLPDEDMRDSMEESAEEARHFVQKAMN